MNQGGDNEQNRIKTTAIQYLRAIFNFLFPKLHFKPDYSRLFVQLWFHFQTQPSHDFVESLKATRSDDPLNRICLFLRSLCSILPTGEEVYSMARLRVLALVLLVSCIVVIASAEKTDQEAEHGGKRLAYRFDSSFFFIDIHHAHFSSLETVPATPEPSTTEATEEESPPPKIECTDPREVYNECGSSCDDRTCENIRRGDHLACTKHCVEGCFCRNGYVRDKHDRCIPSYRCGKGSLVTLAYLVTECEIVFPILQNVQLLMGNLWEVITIQLPFF